MVNKNTRFKMFNNFVEDMKIASKDALQYTKKFLRTNYIAKINGLGAIRKALEIEKIKHSAPVL